MEPVAFPPIMYGPGMSGQKPVAVRSLHTLPNRDGTAAPGATLAQQKSAHRRLDKFRDTYSLKDAPGRGFATHTDRLEKFLDDIDNNYHLYRKPSRIWNVVGLVAGIISFVAVCLQISTIVKRKSACDLSMGFLVGWTAVQFLWVVYSFGNRMYLYGCFTVISFLVVVVMIVLKSVYDKDGKCSNQATQAAAAT